MSFVTITSTPVALDAAAKVLLISLNRGDFDDDPDFDDAAGRACGAFAQAADDAWETSETTEVEVEVEHLDEILALVESDFRATSTALARFITDTRTALTAHDTTRG